MNSEQEEFEDLKRNSKTLRLPTMEKRNSTISDCENFKMLR